MLVSVIVACYNVEQYVEEAVRSAMLQTHQNLEIICVNDASTDQTSEILAKLSQEDSRVKVIHHQKNQGLVAVRCHGVQASQGQYIVFLDGDDYLSPEIIEKALAVSIAQDSDLVHFEADIFPADSLSPEHYQSLTTYLRPHSEPIHRTTPALVDTCFTQRKFAWNAWGKLFKASIVRKAFQLYQDQYINLGEDILLSFMCLIFAQKYTPLNMIGYHYRQGSGMTKVETHFSLDKMRRYAEEYQIYSLLHQWVNTLDLDHKCAEALESVKKLILADAEYAFSQSNPAEREKVCHLFEQYWPNNEMIGIMLRAENYAVNDMVKQADFLWHIRHLPLFVSPKREIKTIGMFYYRMYNGGVERVMALLSSLFCKNGYHVVLFTDEPANSLDYSLPKNIKRIVLPSARDKSIPNIQKRMDAWKSQIEANHVDMMIYHAWCNLDLFYDELAVKLSSIPFVLHTHGYAGLNLRDGDEPYVLQTIMQKRLYCLCDVIIALSSVDRAWWQSLGMRCVATINPATFDPWAIKVSNSSQNIVLWVGRIAAVKQPLEALKIMRLVHDKIPNAKLQMLGMADDVGSLQAVKSYIKEYKMESYVSLEGQQANIKPYYESARVVLWTAKDEGAPMGMVESKTYGLPIVSYDIANVDMIREAKGMCIVPQYDDQGAANHLINLLTNPEYHAEMSAASRSSAEEIFSVDQMKQWEAIFEIATTPKPPELMGSQLPPLETAVQMLLHYLLLGEKCRMQRATPPVNATTSYSPPVVPPSALPTPPPSNRAKWLLKKALKFCTPYGIVTLRQTGLQVANGSKTWLIRQTIKSVLPYGVWWLKNFIHQHLCRR